MTTSCSKLSDWDMLWKGKNDNSILSSAMISLRCGMAEFIAGLSSSSSLCKGLILELGLCLSWTSWPPKTLSFANQIHITHHRRFILKVALRNRKQSLSSKRMKFPLSVRIKILVWKPHVWMIFFNRSMTVSARVHMGKHLEEHTQNVNIDLGFGDCRWFLFCLLNFLQRCCDRSW